MTANRHSGQVGKRAIVLAMRDHARDAGAEPEGVLRKCWVSHCCPWHVVEAGERWGYRQKVWTLGEPVRPVEIVRFGPPQSNKVRVRWLDGEYEGLEEWVPRVRLIVAWDAVEEFRNGEQKELALWATQPDPPDEITGEAVLQVWYSATTELVDFEVRRGQPLWATIACFPEVAAQLPVNRQELLESPGAYVDSKGTLHVAQLMTLELARAFCRSEADAILARGESELADAREAVVTGWVPARHHGDEPWRIAPDKAREQLFETEQVWSLIRSWCGTEVVDSYDERAALRAEVDRMGRLIDETAALLRQAGHPVKAGQLLRNAGRSKRRTAR